MVAKDNKAAVVRYGIRPESGISALSQGVQNLNNEPRLSQRQKPRQSAPGNIVPEKRFEDLVGLTDFRWRASDSMDVKNGTRQANRYGDRGTSR
jgi:hypothetical protein